MNAAERHVRPVPRSPVLVAVVFALTMLLGPGAASAISLAPGDILVADGGAVVKVDPVSGAQTTVVSGLGTLRGIAVDANGLIYVATNDAVRQIDSQAQTFTTLNAISFTDLQGIAVDANGDVFVIDDLDSASDAAILQLDPSSPASPTTVFSGGSYLIDPSDITLDSAGDIYVTELTGGSMSFPNAVIKVSGVSGSQLTFDDKLFDPLGITVDASGDLLVADTGGGSGTPSVIGVDSGSGAQTTFSSDNLLMDPVDLDYFQGKTYVADQSAFSGAGGVIEIDAGGNQFEVTPKDLASEDIVLSGSGIVGLAVFVPEPSTGLLLGLGLALLARRGRRPARG